MKIISIVGARPKFMKVAPIIRAIEGHNTQSPATNHHSTLRSHQAPITDHQLLITEPSGCLDFLNLQMDAKMVKTDSGGLQVETTALAVPCLTLLDSLVWSTAHEQGANSLAGTCGHRLVKRATKIVNGDGKKGTAPQLWDAEPAETIVTILPNIGNIV